MKYCRQQHKRGCGIACVAMITGLPYSWIREDYDEMFGAPEMVKLPHRGAPCLEYGTDAGELHSLLEVNGVRSHKKMMPFKSWEELPDIAILAVYYRVHKSTGKTAFHWVVYNRELDVVMDPWITDENYAAGKRDCIRTDYRRMRPKYYVGAFPSVDDV